MNRTSRVVLMLVSTAAFWTMPRSSLALPPSGADSANGDPVVRTWWQQCPKVEADTSTNAKVVAILRYHEPALFAFRSDAVTSEESGLTLDVNYRQDEGG